MKRATYFPPQTKLVRVRAELGFGVSGGTNWYENEKPGGTVDWNYGGNEETWG